MRFQKSILRINGQTNGVELGGHKLLQSQVETLCLKKENTKAIMVRYWTWGTEERFWQHTYPHLCDVAEVYLYTQTFSSRHRSEVVHVAAHLSGAEIQECVDFVAGVDVDLPIVGDVRVIEFVHSGVPVDTLFHQVVGGNSDEEWGQVPGQHLQGKLINFNQTQNSVYLPLWVLYEPTL